MELQGVVRQMARATATVLGSGLFSRNERSQQSEKRTRNQLGYGVEGLWPPMLRSTRRQLHRLSREFGEAIC